MRRMVALHMTHTNVHAAAAADSVDRLDRKFLICGNYYHFFQTKFGAGNGAKEVW